MANEEEKKVTAPGADEKEEKPVTPKVAKKEEKPVTPKVAKKKDTMIEVPKAKLEGLLARLDRLEYAASKSHLAKYDSNINPEDTKMASVSVFEGNIVTAWQMTENLVEKINGVWIERQSIMLHFLEDVESIEVSAKKFWLENQKKKVLVTSEKRLAGGEVIWEVETVEDGGAEPIRFEIGVTFVN